MDDRNPFAQPGEWYKGCLHVHSTASDGCLSPDEVLDWYHSRGYSFVALTDHDVPSEAEILAEDWITLAGVEVDGLDPAAGLYHLVGLGVEL
ncbi:MAG: phosphotransferase, partial [Anaerolineae bacterium]|nr:phosphotransferase [Anaerolineae bacterium]